MREYLFKAKPVSDSDYYFFSQIWNNNCKDGFVYGSLVVDVEKNYYICVSAMRNTKTYMNNGITSMIKVSPQTVCQFTGSLDKNGKKIFENDIVSRNVIPMLVKYDDDYSSFFAEYDLDGEIYKNIILGSDMLEVIGNIHDNPELIS